MEVFPCKTVYSRSCIPSFPEYSRMDLCWTKKWLSDKGFTYAPPDIGTFRFRPRASLQDLFFHRDYQVFEYFHPKRIISTQEVLREMDREGVRPADDEELLRFAKKYPKEQSKYPIVALGSVGYSESQSDTRVLVLPRSEEPVIGVEVDVAGWESDVRFLVVRERFFARVTHVGSSLDSLRGRFCGDVEGSPWELRPSPRYKKLGRDVVFQLTGSRKYCRSTEDIICAMDEKKLRAARYEELLAFSAKYPNEQLKYPIIALGHHDVDMYLALVHVKRDERRVLHLDARELYERPVGVNAWTASPRDPMDGYYEKKWVHEWDQRCMFLCLPEK